MGRVSPATVVIVGIIAASMLSICVTAALVALFGGLDALRLMTPFVSIIPTFIGGMFGILKYLQGLEERQETRHRANLHRLRQLDTKLDDAVDKATQAVRGQAKKS